MLVFDNLKMMVIWQQMHAGDMMRFLETEIVLARSIRCVFYNFSIKLEILNCYFWSKTTNLVFSPSSLIIGLYRFFIHQDFSFVFVVVWKSKHLIFGIWLIRSYVKKLFFVLLWLSILLLCLDPDIHWMGKDLHFPCIMINHTVSSQYFKLTAETWKNQKSNAFISCTPPPHWPDFSGTVLGSGVTSKKPIYFSFLFLFFNFVILRGLYPFWGFELQTETQNIYKFFILFTGFVTCKPFCWCMLLLKLSNNATTGVPRFIQINHHDRGMTFYFPS